MVMQQKVIITDALVTEVNGQYVIRGIIAPESLRAIDRPSYQREPMKGTKVYEGMMEAHRTGSLPDVYLNMRGTRYDEYDDGSVHLISGTVMVDGLQRISSGIDVMNDEERPATPHQGAYIAVNKDEAWERMMFETLNFDRTQLSANVALRNLKEVLPAMNVLYRFTRNNTSPLFGRVTWTQPKKRGELLTGTVYVKAVGRLHSHFGPGIRSNAKEAAEGIDAIMVEISRKTLEENVREFFTLIETCWGITELKTPGATQLKQGFLFTLARVLADHPQFWDGDRLFVHDRDVAKLKKLDVDAEGIANIAGSTHSSNTSVLYNTILGFLMKNVRASRLETWDDVEVGV